MACALPGFGVTNGGLQPDDPGGRCHAAHPVEGLRGGQRQGAEAQVHHERFRGGAQGGPQAPDHPPVHATQAVGGGRPARDVPDRPHDR